MNGFIKLEVKVKKFDGVTMYGIAYLISRKAVLCERPQDKGKEKKCSPDFDGVLQRRPLLWRR
jgi:hypothetical protein